MRKIYITRKLPEIAIKTLKESFIVDEFPENKRISPNYLVGLVEKYDAILCTPADVFNEELLKKSNKLKVLSNYATGVDNIDVEFANKMGVTIYNTPDVVTQPTADHTFALLLSLTRNIIPSNDFVNKGLWKGWDPYAFLGEDLCGKTIGIIGFGKIGQTVAKRALAFGLNVLYYDNENNKSMQNCSQVNTMNEVLENSDIITLHVPLTIDTSSLIAKEEFLKMDRKPWLINTSRGAVIDTDALVTALKSNLIKGVALDVTDPEPILKNHPLLKYNNCIITPHIGTATNHCRNMMAKIAAENIINHFKDI